MTDKFDQIERAKVAVNHLLGRGMSHERIASELDNVSARSIYRWARGEHAPKSEQLVVALENLAGVSTPE
jgi:hypothetical protein